jgi:hypothetical protein
MKINRIPFISLGILLILVGASPTVIGMMRAFLKIVNNGEALADESWIEIAFHPIFMACSTLGILLVIMGAIIKVRS